jgi:hypothetical protein
MRDRFPSGLPRSGYLPSQPRRVARPESRDQRHVRMLLQVPDPEAVRSPVAGIGPSYSPPRPRPVSLRMKYHQEWHRQLANAPGVVS